MEDTPLDIEGEDPEDRKQRLALFYGILYDEQKRIKDRMEDIRARLQPLLSVDQPVGRVTLKASGGITPTDKTMELLQAKGMLIPCLCKDAISVEKLRPLFRANPDLKESCQEKSGYVLRVKSCVGSESSVETGSNPPPDVFPIPGGK